MKRHTALQPISRQHHQLLLAALLLQKGIERGTPISILQAFAAQTWQQLGQPYCQQMHQFLLPALMHHPQMDIQARQVEKLLQQVETNWNAHNQWHRTADIAALPVIVRKLVRYLERDVFENWQTRFSPNCLVMLRQLQEPAQDCLHFSPAFWE